LLPVQEESWREKTNETQEERDFSCSGRRTGGQQSTTIQPYRTTRLSTGVGWGGRGEDIQERVRKFVKFQWGVECTTRTPKESAKCKRGRGEWGRKNQQDERGGTLYPRPIKDLEGKTFHLSWRKSTIKAQNKRLPNLKDADCI